MRFKQRLAALAGFVFLLCMVVTSKRLVGAADVEICNDVNAHMIFVQQSLEKVEVGADRSEVIETLACIAKSDSPDSLVHYAAVRALFHLAPDDQVRQKRLMNFLLELQGNGAARYSASRLLIYVVDANGRKTLQEHVESTWRNGRISPAFGVLVELGDPSFRLWLENAVAALPADDFRHNYTARYRRYLELLEDTDTLLEALGSDRTDIDRAWLVRQGMRLRIERAKIRKAVLRYLGDAPPTRFGIGHTELVFACDEAEVLLPQDANKNKEVQIVRDSLRAMPDEGLFPSWMTMPDQKRSEFYGFAH